MFMLFLQWVAQFIECKQTFSDIPRVELSLLILLMMGDSNTDVSTYD